MADTIRAIVKAGVPVMGHIGLTPQTAGSLGGFKVQGGTPERAAQLIEDAKTLEEAGVFSMVLECVPKGVAKALTAEVNVPVLGIGAGPYGLPGYWCCRICWICTVISNPNSSNTLHTFVAPW